MLWDDDAVLPPVPRTIPRSLSLVLRCGGPMGSIGWSFFGLGMIFVCVFFSFRDSYRSVRLNLGALETTGTITEWRVTNMQINEEDVVANHYTYTLQGTQYTGISYQTGVGLATGAPVTVQFLSRDPRVSRIQGMRVGRAPAWTIFFVGIFPLIGLILISIVQRRGRRWVHLLRSGVEADGHVLDHERTGVEINEEPQVAVTLGYTPDDGIQRTTVFKTIEPSELMDDRVELILYDPRKPDLAMPIDGMPDLVHLGREGQFLPVTGSQRLRVLVPLGLAVVTVLATVVTNL